MLGQSLGKNKEVELVWLIPAGGLATALLFLLLRNIKQSEDRAWQAAAKALGIEAAPGGMFGSPRLQGRVNGFEVLVQLRPVEPAPVNPGDEPSYTHFLINTRGGVPLSFRAGRAGANHRSLASTEPLVLSEDPLFDQAVQVHGPRAKSIAILGTEARSKLLHFTKKHNGVVSQGNIEVERPGRLDDTEQLVEVVREMIDLANTLAIPSGGLPPLLFRNLREDRSPKVRTQNLAILLDEYPDSEEAKRAPEKALEDSVAEVRLCAAQRMGEAGIEVAKEIFHAAEEPPDIRAKALAFLTKTLPSDSAESHLDEALASELPELVREGIKQAEKISYGGAVPALQMLESSDTGDIAAAANRAVRSIAPEAANPRTSQEPKADR